MKLSVIIPVYNEKNYISSILEKVKDVPLEKEIIIVDDGSTDGTTEILKQIRSDKEIKIIFQARNEGKGTAIRSGLKEITGDIVVIQDADLEYEPMDYLKLVEPIISGKTKVVYGSRILGRCPKSSLAFYLGGRFLSLLTSLLYNVKITDEPTGYKTFDVPVLKSLDLKCQRFEFCPEVTAKVLKKGYKIYEVPINYHPRKISEGKKINWKDGLQAVWTLIKYRFCD